MNAKYVPMKYFDALLVNGNLENTYSWENELRAVKLDRELMHLDNYFVPVRGFSDAPLKDYFEKMKPDLLVEVEHHDYKNIMEKVRTFWLAKIKKVAGYRVLVSWLAADEPQDEKFQFWINLGSEELCSIGYTKQQKLMGKKTTCTYIPPAFLSNRLHAKGFDNAIASCMNTVPKYVCMKGLNEIRRSNFHGNFIKEGTRIELLDYNQSNRVRPGVVIQNVQGRLRVQVRHEDCDITEEEDRQYARQCEFWVDQKSFFVLPVGWATYNGYGLAAKKEYTTHANQIAVALRAGIKPEYASIDLQAGQLKQWRNDQERNVKWKKGMRFELMDPLGATVRDLYVASCLEVLKDGYIRVAMDGPDAEEECLPVHSSSPLLFPVGYAKKHGITLHGPNEDTEEDFNWNDYLREIGAIAAPFDLFKGDPTLERINMFTPGAHLEAADVVENVFICAATVAGIKGRLVHVHFDGWEPSFDQYFDIDSNDLFPIGWCELTGYKLEEPKQEKTKKKK